MAKNDTVDSTKTVEPTIEMLKEENSALKAQVSTLKEENSALKAQVSTLKEENSALKAQVSTLQDEIDINKSQIEALEIALTEKDAALELARKSEQTSSVKIDTGKKTALSVPADTFTIEGKKYRFKKASFIIGQRKTTAQEALEDDALLVTLIDYPSVVEEVD